jgi:hypothetical protein
MDRERVIEVAGPVALLTTFGLILALVRFDPFPNDGRLTTAGFLMVVSTIGLPLWIGPVLLIRYKDHPAWMKAGNWLPLRGQWLCYGLALVLGAPGCVLAVLTLVRVARPLFLWLLLNVH